MKRHFKDYLSNGKVTVNSMLFKTRGIVFRAIKYSETSIITEIYTEEKGLQKYIVNGVRSKKGRNKAGLYQVMSLVDMVAYYREGKELNRIKEIRPALLYQQLPFDVYRGAIGLFIAEVARKSIREAEENRPLFDLLFSTFQHLDECPDAINNIHLYFLLQLSGHLGFMPGDTYTPEAPFFDLEEGQFTTETPHHPNHLSPELSQKLALLLDMNLYNCHQLRLSGPERRQLLLKLLDFYRLHIDNFPEINSHTILQEVLR